MSGWLNTSHLSSLAKTALSEAQKTIDKALDIDEETPKGHTKGPRVPSPTEEAPGTLSPPVVTSSRSSSRSSSVTSSDLVRAGVSSLTSSIRRDPAKLWGSFTGSFFEAGQVGGQGQKGQNETGEGVIEEEEPGEEKKDPEKGIRSFDSTIHRVW